MTNVLLVVYIIGFALSVRPIYFVFVEYGRGDGWLMQLIAVIATSTFWPIVAFADFHFVKMWFVSSAEIKYFVRESKR